MSKETQQSAHESDHQAQLDRLRSIIISPAVDEVTQKLSENQRELVSNVLSEAIHDREQQDGSIQRVIQPIVTKSVEKSIKAQRDEFVDYLFPIVGSLVRKSVTVFISDFIEKTNQLIENSFSIRGLKWRYQAWRSGISFSKYVASQTFLFQVEQVFLIHKQTGMLLNSVHANSAQQQDADLISGMLTAINDFVVDSFTGTDAEQHLGEIKTDDFTLVLKSGPQAIVVAAVTGNLSPMAANTLQLATEEIHQLNASQLRNFNGDPQVFESTTSTLSQCLLSEALEHPKTKKRTPIWGILITLLIIVFVAWYSFGWWHTSHTAKQLLRLPVQQGIVVTNISVNGRYDVSVNMLRDPEAISAQQWSEDINLEYVKLVENPFISVDPKIVERKIIKAVIDFPELTFDAKKGSLSGQIEASRRQQLLNKITAIQGIEQLNLDLSELETIAVKIDLTESSAVLKQTFKQLIGDISQQQLAFDVGSSDLAQHTLPQISQLAQSFRSIQQIAEKLNRSVSLLIVGASDTSGESAYNRRLSQLRADNTKRLLVDLNIDSKNLFAIGIGEVSLSGNIKATRKVLFNVIFTDLAQQTVTQTPEAKQ